MPSLVSSSQLDVLLQRPTLIPYSVIGGFFPFERPYETRRPSAPSPTMANARRPSRTTLECRRAFPSALKDGQMVMLHIPYPRGFFAKGLGRAHRRPERRLEGPRTVEHERRPHAVADGGWQGVEAARRPHPGTTRSAGEVDDCRWPVIAYAANAWGSLWVRSR